MLNRALQCSSCLLDSNKNLGYPERNGWMLWSTIQVTILPPLKFCFAFLFTNKRTIRNTSQIHGWGSNITSSKWMLQVHCSASEHRLIVEVKVISTGDTSARWEVGCQSDLAICKYVQRRKIQGESIYIYFLCKHELIYIYIYYIYRWTKRDETMCHGIFSKWKHFSEYMGLLGVVTISNGRLPTGSPLTAPKVAFLGMGWETPHL